mmetsp:Transcript_70111/g.106020  ORF Transcript_70111/g.106020 Transcript_70111/m.106020 type:complete len:261 (+) Transcript_70111:127-909(+)|eukprot:CAMPEP_0117020154 /NCGR_PEP_ID=MMETSP0472-20121206/15358_1 /TAXON_ID=693140 ORGANISM="Tiarina fusus, Strain LIS" /NCGR_SAMPLE_ID=MMETSP0472 /ASSEMBLY_ACC=CAM_ASM_000603 /LENGTH=260 /DNA_ID=CAMNT_0004725287 /DNA_START=120 /DNA_END=902 /DNA_ORIENTATION=-
MSAGSNEKTPEEFKELGNEAFSKQDFESAVEHYTKAIQLDPSNHVFFSNRSASYAGLKDWAKATEDAKECIRLDPQFMKGYYRLATAQLELKDYDMAQATIKQGLALDANNSQLLKVLRSIKLAKKAATTGASAVASGSGQQRKVDAASSKELYDLQIQNSQTVREYQTVQANLTKAQREQKIKQVTLDELETAQQAKGYYRSMGKIFVKSTRERVTDHLRSSIQEHSKKESDLSQKLDYLERRIKSQQQNMEELLSSGD